MKDNLQFLDLNMIFYIKDFHILIVDDQFLIFLYQNFYDFLHFFHLINENYILFLLKFERHDHKDFEHTKNINIEKK